MLEDMQVRNLSPHTQRACVEHVARFVSVNIGNSQKIRCGSLTLRARTLLGWWSPRLSWRKV